MKRFDFEKGPIRRQVCLGGSRAQSRNCRAPDLGFLGRREEREETGGTGAGERKRIGLEPVKSNWTNLGVLIFWWGAVGWL